MAKDQKKTNLNDWRPLLDTVGGDLKSLAKGTAIGAGLAAAGPIPPLAGLIGFLNIAAASRKAEQEHKVLETQKRNQEMHMPKFKERLAGMSPEKKNRTVRRLVRAKVTK